MNCFVIQQFELPKTFAAYNVHTMPSLFPFQLRGHNCNVCFKYCYKKGISVFLYFVFWYDEKKEKTGFLTSFFKCVLIIPTESILSTLPIILRYGVALLPNCDINLLARVTMLGSKTCETYIWCNAPDVYQFLTHKP